VAQVRAALNSHEVGQFESSAAMFDTMYRDERLASVLDTRILGLLGLPFSLEPPEDATPKHEEVRDTLLAWWEDMVPTTELAMLYRWYLGLGTAPGELLWTPGKTEWRARLRAHHPQFAWVDESVLTYNINTQTGTTTLRLPWDDDESKAEAQAGDGKWVWFTDADRGYMNGLIRSLALPWISRQFVMRDQQRHSERHGMPIIKAMVPATASGDDRDEFFDDLRQLATETTVMLPTHLDEGGAQYDLELLEAKANDWEGFDRLLASINVSMAIRVLGQNLTTEIQGGAYSAAQIHERILHDILAGDEKRLSHMLREQVLRPVVALNWGDPDLAPCPHWDVDPPSDTKSEADTVLVVGQGLQAIKDVGLQVKDLDAFAERFGLELEERDTSNDPPPPPMMLPPQMQPPPDGQEEPDDEGDEDADETDEQEEAMSAFVQLQSGDRVPVSAGFVQGQRFTDGLADASAGRAAVIEAPGLVEMMKIVREATSFDDAKAKLRAQYAGLSPAKLAAMNEKTLLLGELTGRWAVLEEV
jgi:phage gp29-like protein